MGERIPIYNMPDIREGVPSDIYPPFYDPNRSYEENYEHGPFGPFADGERYKQDGEPQQEVLGQEVYLPFGIPPGPLLNSKFAIAALEKGFDIAAYKTVRTREYPCAPFPNVLAVHLGGDLTMGMAQTGLVGDTEYTHPISITNSFGVPSRDPDFWQRDMAKAVSSAGRGQFVIGGFQGTTGNSEEEFIEDFAVAARLVRETGVPVLEANLSCPNEGTGHLLCFDVERTERVVNTIKEEIGNTPLIVKLAYFDDQAQLGDLMQRIGKIVEGVAAINTIPTKIWKDLSRKEAALPGGNRLVAGVCGSPIKWAGLEMVGRLDQLRQDNGYGYSILGIGGVTTPQDYFEYRSVGADAVMSATGAMWNPYLAQEIKSLT